MDTFNFQITEQGPISNEFRKRNIDTFTAAADFIKRLPYRRNSDKNRLAGLFDDQCGTCSTKHAVLKALALENNKNTISLIVGLFKMNEKNTKAVSATLRNHRLEFIPEAHCYLKHDGAILDFTKDKFALTGFAGDLLEELEIQPQQINEFKVAYHKNYLSNWLKDNQQINYTLEELWTIREQCIQDLSMN